MGIDKIIATLDMNNHEAALIEKDMDTDKDRARTRTRLGTRTPEQPGNGHGVGIVLSRRCYTPYYGVSARGALHFLMKAWSCRFYEVHTVFGNVLEIMC